MIARLLAAWLAALSAGALGADQPPGVLGITLGTSYARLLHDLDMRDISTALAQIKGSKPDLGRRGYGCMRRDDPFADIGCVSHEEKPDGLETREIRLHFLAGRLMQMSLTAEVQHYEAVIDYLRRRYGAPQQAQENTWRTEAGNITAHRGPDLIFVNFELDAYAAAVKRKREGASAVCS